jgi:hypothetical protein
LHPLKSSAFHGALFHQLTGVGFSSDLWQHVKRHVAGQRAPRSEMSVAFSAFDLARVDSGESNLYPRIHVQS